MRHCDCFAFDSPCVLSRRANQEDHQNHGHPDRETQDMKGVISGDGALILSSTFDLQIAVILRQQRNHAILKGTLSFQQDQHHVAYHVYHFTNLSTKYISLYESAPK